MIIPHSNLLCFMNINTRKPKGLNMKKRKQKQNAITLYESVSTTCMFWIITWKSINMCSCYISIKNVRKCQCWIAIKSICIEIFTSKFINVFRVPTSGCHIKVSISSFVSNFFLISLVCLADFMIRKKIFDFHSFLGGQKLKPWFF